MPILNIEDHAPARFLRSRVLQQAGYTVREGERAEDALLGAMAEPRPRLVLLDLRLPDGDGLDICERLKRLRPELPVILITSAHRTAQSRREGFAAGAAAYLLEPVSPGRLVETVRRFVEAEQPSGEAPPAVAVTDALGIISSVNETASRLLNVSQRSRANRSLVNMVLRDRSRLLRLLELARDGEVVQENVTLRPMERKAFDARIDVSVNRDGDLEWLIEPV
jgi:DNA-binding response OmpR family regulator